ncbi:MAG: ferritin-like domain-containing protein [Nitrospirae bacterium]|nr:MAG: ferritin-like domain-containing protein [Nitrospirota bacterium]
MLTSGTHAKSDCVTYLVQETLAAEIVCVLRYKRHYFTARGISTKSVAQSLRNSIRNDLMAQRIAIDRCLKMIRRTDEPASRRMLEGILAREEEHAEDLSSLLVEFSPYPIPVT